MVNVPSAVWIDEEGRIVRPPESAWTRSFDFGGLIQVDGEPYVAALRDWVARGAESAFALSEAQVAERLSAAADPARGRADAHFQLALFLHAGGDTPGAARHFAEAQRHAPDNWNYHRQEWFYAPAEERSAKWRAKFEALEGRPYYVSPDLGE